MIILTYFLASEGALMKILYSAKERQKYDGKTASKYKHLFCPFLLRCSGSLLKENTVGGWRKKTGKHILASPAKTGAALQTLLYFIHWSTKGSL